MMPRGSIERRYGPLVGRTFGNLTLENILYGRRKHRRVVGRFRCNCGGSVDYPIGRVRSGRYPQHCGCQTDMGSHRTHGMRDSPEYSSWSAMKVRCLCPENKDYPRYGGRGVTVHPEWVDSFEAFFQHIGPRPEGTSIDRIDTTRGYEPGNVRWATPEQQARNRRDTWIVSDGEREYMGMNAAAEAHSVSGTCIMRWCRSGKYGFSRRRRYA